MKSWRDIQGWFTWPEIYDRMAQQAKPGDTLVELGVWRGRSLAYLADKLAGRSIRLCGVDRFDCTGENTAYHLELSRSQQLGDKRTILEQCRGNLEDCGHRWVELIQSDSIEAAKLFEDNSVRFLFVDDFHNSDHVEKELRAWLPKLKRPTWIAGDDWGLVLDGVLRVFPDAQVESSCWVANVV